MSGRFAVRGVSYDTGTRYVGGVSSRERWAPDEARRDLRSIATDLHCNSVALFGSDLERLVAAAEIAQHEGLHVSLQPRPIDAEREAFLATVVEAAEACRRLAETGRITLNVGCELSLFLRGFLPGRSFLTRMKTLAFLWPLLPLINRRLNRLLTIAAATARTRFDGQITYSAGVWESIDWTPFDLAGVNLYRDRDNEKTYHEDLRRHLACGRPLVITEFGCCSFRGGERLGGGGWLAIDHGRNPPEVKPGHVRSEEAQAWLIGELIDLFAAEGVHGAYVYTFMEPGNFRSDDPRFDLDMASYGIVSPPGSPSGEAVPKLAFSVVGEQYARLAAGTGETGDLRG